MPAKTAQAGLYSRKRLRAFARSRFFTSFFMEMQCDAYWLMKSEPDEVSFDDVLAAPGQTVAWFGVRNYQARNFMRDGMQVGDGILFYHSSCAVPGVAGIARSGQRSLSGRQPIRQRRQILRPESHAGTTALDIGRRPGKRKGALFAAVRNALESRLEDMVLLQKGSRLSISPVTGAQWNAILDIDSHQRLIPHRAPSARKCLQ